MCYTHAFVVLFLCVRSTCFRMATIYSVKKSTTDIFFSKNFLRIKLIVRYTQMCITCEYFFLLQLFCEKSHRVRIFVLHIRDSSTKDPPVALEPKTFKTKSIIYLLFDGNHWPFDLKRKHYVVDGRN